MLFTDKYKPKNLNNPKIYEMFHLDLIELLKKIAKDDDVPHMIFYGPEGSGKKTLIYSFLELLFGQSIHNTSYVNYTVTGSGNSSTDVMIKQSPHHIEIKPNKNNFDLHMIQDIVKTYATRSQISFFIKRKTFKIILIHGLDNLSFVSQTSLRRTMENYSESCRFIMWARSLSKVIQPLKSRCFRLRVPSPSNDQIFIRLFHICGEEKIKIGLEELYDIVNTSSGNIRKALWMLELYKNKKGTINHYKFKHIEFKNFYHECNGDATLENVELLHTFEETDPKTKESFISVDKSQLDILIKSFKMDKKLANKNSEKYKYTSDKLYKHNYDISLKEIIDMIVSRNFNNIYRITNVVYSILITNINKDRILRDLITLILEDDRVPQTAKFQITKYGAMYDHNITRCRREIIHLQGFIIKAMYLINKYKNEKL